MSQSTAVHEHTLIVATAGHVDHGKTSLINHITGVDTDTLPEEKARGLSINLGYAYLHIDNGRTIGFVDVPGHTDFINNMLAGVGAVDAALLVVAADDGIMPQTREHFAILQLLGISRLVVALSKVDRCDAERVAKVTADIDTLLQDSTLAGAPVFPVSNLDGSGVPALTACLQSWLDTHTQQRADDHLQHFRFLIDRSFTVKGIGTVVTGSARAGMAAIGQTVVHSGTGSQTKLRGLRLDQTAIEQIHRGQRAAANITLNHTDINRGDWLVEAPLLHPVRRFDARVQFVVDTPHIVTNAQYHLHLGASHHIVTLRRLGDDDSPWFQIKSTDTAIAHYGDRFVLRDPAAQHTIAGGQVIDIFVPRRGRTSPQRLAILEAMHRSASQAIEELLALLPEGLDLAQFALCRNLTATAVSRLLAELDASGLPFNRLPGNRNDRNDRNAWNKSNLPVILHRDRLEQHAAVILNCLQDYHRKHGNQQGMSEPALSRDVRFAGSHRLLHGILQELISGGRIKRTGTLLHLPDHQSTLSKEERQFLEKIRPLLLQAGKVPPRTRELVDMTGIPLKALDNLLRLNSKAGTLIKVAENRYYLPETIMELADHVEQLIDANDDDEGFSVIQFRDTTGIGRNLCIEVLEYFDKIGFTRRDDNKRFLRTSKDNIF